MTRRRQVSVGFGSEPRAQHAVCRIIKVIPYEERYIPEFIMLNRQWLEDFGLLEEADEKNHLFESPRGMHSLLRFKLPALSQ